MSTDLAPFSACSSPVVNSISIPAGGVPSRTSRRTAPRIVTTAALLSAPRMASWRFVSRPSWLTTSTGPSSGTVSMCAHRSTVGEPSGPGTRASRLPESEPVCGCAVVLLHLDAQAAELLRQRLRDRALPARRALDLAEADELGEEPLALLTRHGVDHAANATARSASPLAPSAGRPPSTTWITSPAPSRFSRLAAIAARWPDAQITATGCPASSPSGSSWMSW